MEKKVHPTNGIYSTKKFSTHKDLDQNSISFGKYKNLSLSDILSDLPYCRWLVEQEWLKTQHEYFYNKITEHICKIRTAFYSQNFSEEEHGELDTVEKFLKRYRYFTLLPLNEVRIELTEEEKTCYTFFLRMMESFKQKILRNVDVTDNTQNPYDIKAPKSWLLLFEKEYQLPRETFKKFLTKYDLPNMTTIIEQIKQQGGIVYKGAQSFKIAKQNSLKQEEFWFSLLKSVYGENISAQYKFRKNIFDFIDLKNRILFECKINLTDFNPDQYKKYREVITEEELVSGENFRLFYLISEDCIADMDKRILYTLDTEKYTQIISTNKSIHGLFTRFEIQSIKDLKKFFKRL